MACNTVSLYSAVQTSSKIPHFKFKLLGVEHTRSWILDTHKPYSGEQADFFDQWRHMKLYRDVIMDSR